MAGSDSLLIYIKSSGGFNFAMLDSPDDGFNFAMLASPDDDIASLKKKAEAQHLALFPQHGRIVAHALKMWIEGTCYYLADDIPVSRVVIGNHGIRLLYMDARSDGSSFLRTNC